MSSEKFAMFEDQKYISLETFKKNGSGVKTPVWFVMHDGIIYVTTMDSSWKVKRLKNTKLVRITPSNFKGTPKKEWIEGQAFFGSESELKLAMSLRNKKYGLWARIIGLFVSKKGKVVVIGIKI
ncbi:MAG TPA: PPOX class F420-dependent oxidoreductase [Candidatus Nitrosotalea sp.]|nr:PPOX class F420-dependent oxidoreductase [Candidatus Nitrosotalea sp.]